MSQNGPDELSAKLRTWKVEPRLPGSFEREVWQRIATRTAAREEAVWPSLLRWFSDELARPRYALSLLAVSLSLGVGVAHVRAQEANARNMKTLEARYAASISPLAHAKMR